MERHVGHAAVPGNAFPEGLVAQGITLVDAGTFDLYMQNMKSLFMDMVQDSDLVIFDRCVEGTKAASYKRNIRAVNPRHRWNSSRRAASPSSSRMSFPST